LQQYEKDLQHNDKKFHDFFGVCVCIAGNGSRNTYL